MKKNFVLKRRGLWCCSVFELLVPTVFVALMCLPKSLVKDEKNTDVLYREHSLGGGWNLDGQSGNRDGTIEGSGWKFTVTPDTVDAIDIARRAYVNFMCMDTRTNANGRDVYNVSYQIPRVVSMGWNKRALKNTSDEGLLSDDIDVRFASEFLLNKSAEFAFYAGKTEAEEDCSDLCLKDQEVGGCYERRWSSVLNAFVKAFETEDEMAEYRYNHSGTVLAELVFWSSNTTTKNNKDDERNEDKSVPMIFDIDDDETEYTIRLNRTHFGGRKSLSRATDRAYATEWQSDIEVTYWKRFERSIQIQQAVDQAIVDKKDTLSEGKYSVQIDASMKPFPAVGYNYNVGGIIAASFFGFVGTIAFQSSAILVMKTIVVEKELKLREGMKMMGLTDLTYWSSWLFTHWISAMVTVVSMTLVGIYPFEYTNQWFQFMFYSVWVLSNILFNFMITTWFDKSLTATIVSLFIYNLSIQPATQVRIVDPDGSGNWLLSCLLPAGALNMWGHILAQLELTKDGITAKTFTKSVAENANISAASIFSITIFNCFFYGFFTFYFDKVLPKEFGQRLPPWFLFTKSYWFPKTEVNLRRNSHVENDEDNSNGAIDKSEFYEPIPHDSTESISVKNLRKLFPNGVAAIDNLSVNFVPGQVSALLGHNGAGKTTTINILTGAMIQSSGEATINGFDVATQMSSIRLSLGICPQFDVLWPVLTCREHLKLYAALSQNQVVMSNLDKAIEDALKEVDLLNKIDEQSRNLSGGMKRKLSLACAFIGDPSIVFLDEPTSGMDPYSRRFTWEVIRKRAQSGKTILLTTHFMDEADLLCDRVAIMSAGSLACVGSPVFLKSKFGTGYTLTLAKDIDGDLRNNNGDNSESYLTGLQKQYSKKALHFVRKIVTEAKLISDVGTEVTISLPLDKTHLFAELLQKIDDELQALGFTSYGITCTTLEEVFLKVASKADHLSLKKSLLESSSKNHERNNTNSIVDEIYDESAREAFVVNYEERAQYVTGGALLIRQIRFLLWKRYLNWKRTLVTTFMQLLLPCAFFALALYMTTVSFERKILYKPTTFDRATHVDGRNILATYNSGDTVAESIIGNSWPENNVRVADTLGAAMIPCNCNCPAKKQEAFFPALSCCLYDTTKIGFNPYACGDPTVAEAIAGFPFTDASGNCAQSPIHGVNTQLGSCEYLADNSFDGTLLGLINNVRKPCNLRPSAAPCDAIWINSYNQTNGVYEHTLYTDVTAYHALGTTVNEANTAILRHRSGNQKSKIKTTLEWFETAKQFKDGEIVEESDSSLVLMFTTVFSVMGGSILTAAFAVFPVIERANNTKHLQLVSGVNKVMYWLSHFIADMFQMVVPLLTITVVFAAYDVKMFRDELGTIFTLLLFFLIASIPYAHAGGFFFKTGFTAFVGEIGIVSFLGVITTITGIILYNLRDLNAQTKMGSDISGHIFAIVVPHYSLGRGLFDLGMLYNQKNSQVYDMVSMKLVDVVAKSVWDTMKVHYGYLGFNFVTFTFIVALLERLETVKGRKHISEINEEKRVKRISTQAKRAEKIRLAAERKNLARSQRRGFTDRPVEGNVRSTNNERDLTTMTTSNEPSALQQVTTEEPEAEDEDVLAERRRVLSANNLTINDGVIIKDLVKSYGTKKKNAVNHLSVGMAHSQIFGLLGVNGAGKTTTFKMLTGEFAPTSGDALIRDYTSVSNVSSSNRALFSVSNDLNASRQRIGYCPQFDGLQLNLTGREHVKLYAAIRGVPLSLIDDTVSKLLNEIKLLDAADRMCGTYSGGMKRKLSVALALVGAPCVVLLDEPSTGMDPEAKRFLWDVISTAAKSRTIVLTSHSMEECEALCHRVGIMVSGQFRCIGSLQHLKNRFSEGYSVTVNFNKQNKQRVTEFCLNELKATIAEEHSSELKLRVANTTTPTTTTTTSAPADVETNDEQRPIVKLWQVFRDLERCKKDALILDYSVSQTTLEQVFVRFASKQGMIERQ